MSNPVYFTKEDAAALSGLSVRRIQELAKAGEIRRHYQRDQETNRNIALFLAEDLQQLRMRRIAGNPDANITWKQPPQIAAAPSTQWLTLADAALYVGLPESFLRSLVEHGKLPAFDVGVRAGGRYRVSRRDLEAMEAPKHYGGPKKKRIGSK